ncbi:MAG: hypothetical protein IKL25_11605 [Clostridia bacterium]|nr:hypothetical protein [Clostridia bacterium]
MQQLYLTGIHAASLADQLFNSLNVRPSGYRLVPFTIGGSIRGEAMRLLLPPAAAMDNDTPCRIRLRETDWTIIPRALEEIAAPNLRNAVNAHMPILLGWLDAQMLTCTAFREAVVSLLTSPRPVIVACSDDAEEILRALTPADRQLWFPVPDSAQGRAALLEELVAEASMRL